jgi:hypothetical protein
MERPTTPTSVAPTRARTDTAINGAKRDLVDGRCAGFLAQTAPQRGGDHPHTRRPP